MARAPKRVWENVALIRLAFLFYPTWPFVLFHLAFCFIPPSLFVLSHLAFWVLYSKAGCFLW